MKTANIKYFFTILILFFGLKIYAQAPKRVTLKKADKIVKKRGQNYQVVKGNVIGSLKHDFASIGSRVALDNVRTSQSHIIVVNRYGAVRKKIGIVLAMPWSYTGPFDIRIIGIEHRNKIEIPQAYHPLHL